MAVLEVWMANLFLQNETVHSHDEERCAVGWKLTESVGHDEVVELFLSSITSLRMEEFQQASCKLGFSKINEMTNKSNHQPRH